VALLIRRDSVDGGNQSFDRREIQQANTFAAPRVLKHVGNLWALRIDAFITCQLCESLQQLL
jgi:hypothetical protein